MLNGTNLDFFETQTLVFRQKSIIFASTATINIKAKTIF